MRVFITGIGGQLGHDMANELVNRGHECIGSDIQSVYSGVADGSSATLIPYISLDITDAESVSRIIDNIKPDAIVHCAAWTAVDAAEDPQNQEKVYAINVSGTENIARAAKKADAKMIYTSTDYVFNGQGNIPWSPDDTCFEPLKVYGKSNVDGEFVVKNILEKYFIVRIAWVFGINGNNFVKTMLKVGKTHDEVRVVNDQIGTPTYTYDLARLLADMLETDKYGCYHATNSEADEGGYISWYDFCCEIYMQAGLNTQVKPVSTEEYGSSIAKRPLNSRMDKSKLVEAGFVPLPCWQDAIARYLKELKSIGEE